MVALAGEIEPLRATGPAGGADPVAVAQGAMFLWTPPPRTGWQRTGRDGAVPARSRL